MSAFTRIFSTTFLVSLSLMNDAPCSSEEVEFTLKTSVKKAISYAHDIHLARERIVEAEKQHSMVFSKAFPSISGNALISERKETINMANRLLFGGEPYNYYEAGLELSQPIYQGGSFFAGLSAAKKEQEIRSLELELAEREVVANVIRSFCKLLYSQKRIELIGREVEFQKNLLTTATRKFKNRLGEELDMVQIQTELELLKPQAVEAKAQLKTDIAEFAGVVGLPENSSIKLTGTSVLHDWSGLYAKMQAQRIRRAEIEKAETTLSQAEDKKDLEMAKHLPKVDFVSRIGRISTKRTDLLVGEGPTYWSFGIQLTLPLFSGLSSVFERQALSSRVAQFDLESAKLRNQLAVQQVKTTQELESNSELISAIERAIEYAKKALQVANGSYSKGRIPYLQVFEAQKNLSRTELSLEKAQYDRIVKASEYFAANGWALSELVDWLDR
ncbi:MAG: TolC family protein [Bacteriovoracia bacterium]